VSLVEWCAFDEHPRPARARRMTVAACEDYNRDTAGGIAGDHRRLREYLDFLFRPGATAGALRLILERVYVHARAQYEAAQAAGEDLARLHDVLVALGDPETEDEGAGNGSCTGPGYWGEQSE
jgi:hypothetical protein